MRKPKMVKKLQKTSKVSQREETCESNLLDRLEDDLELDGIRLFEQPTADENYLALPADLTESESKDLGKYLNAFTQQKIWVKTLMGRVGISIRGIQDKLDLQRAKIYPELHPKMSIREKELALVDVEPKLVEELSYFELKLALLEDYVANIDTAIFNISREITRREKDFDQFNRNENIGRPTRRISLNKED